MSHVMYYLHVPYVIKIRRNTWCMTISDIGMVHRCLWYGVGWLRFVGSFKFYASFAEYGLFDRALLQKRPIILRSLLIVATPYIEIRHRRWRYCIIWYMKRRHSMVHEEIASYGTGRSQTWLDTQRYGFIHEDIASHGSWREGILWFMKRLHHMVQEDHRHD